MEMLTLRVEAEDFLRITKAARRARTTRSHFIRRAVLEAVARQRASASAKAE